ncbi:MAG: hypothetical protein JOZ70_12410 [Pseudolabrys sp.]|nr:hypothetical protein [Pseudolabrys sp.]MBV9956039.1 hypothetical protein [Pseudolabrys sp.]
MKKTSIAVASLALGGLFATTTVASAQICVLGAVIAAFHKNATENRELTAKEAATCGLIQETDPKEIAKARRNAKPQAATSGAAAEPKARRKKRAAKPT